MKTLALGLLALCGACSEPAPSAAVDGGPTDVPFMVIPYLASLPDGGSGEVNLNLVIQLSLGDAGPIEGILDTGSSGIQLLADLLPPATLAAIAPGTVHYAYSFPELGIEARGTIDTATVIIGDRATSSQIPIVVYDQLSCTSPSLCPSDGGLEPYVFNGYPAIVGVGLRNTLTGGAAVGSPIAQLPGQPPFIVKAPAVGGDAGLLRIGPSVEEIAAYTTFQLPADPLDPALPNGTESWDDWAIPSCIDDANTATDYCANGLLDTGTQFMAMWWTGQASTVLFPPASNVSVSMGPADDLLGQFEVTVGSPPQDGLDCFSLGPALPDDGDLLVLGLPVFSRYDVLFDGAKGQVGLLAH
jgi:hypothetical protein